MFLSFLRHGDAVSFASSDAARDLTDEGKKSIRKLALHLKNSGETYEVIFSSPLVRAKETASIFREIFDCELFEEIRLGCGCQLGEIQAMIREYQNFKNFLFVGHAPDMGVISGELLGTSQEIPFKKGGILKLSTTLVRPEKAILIYFLHPGIV